jgi:predicted DNA-binding transcriptional regulator YafY
MALIPLLIAERPHSQRELSNLFRVSSKTIRRDVDILSRHYPIVSIREDKELRYAYSDGYEYHPPTLTPAELATLLLAQEAIATTGLGAVGSPFARYGRSLLAKVRASLPTLLREKLDGLANVLGSATVPAKDFTPYWETIDRLTGAAVERRRVVLNYYTLARGATTERKVDPYCIYFDPDGATLKLIGFDHYRRQIIPFAIDHIISIEETHEAFERPADFNLREYLSENCFNGIHGEPVTVRLRAHGVAARIFAERTFHPSQRIVERTADSVSGSAGIPAGNARAGMSLSEPQALATGSVDRESGRASQDELATGSVARPSGRASQDAGSREGTTQSTVNPRRAKPASPDSAEETTTIEMRVAGGRGLERFILSWSPDVEVLEPRELREKVAEAHRLGLSMNSPSVSGVKPTVKEK